ncbi:putative tyrosine-protein phosphatase [Wickerhamomyces ciferrii]|uniref:Tyrosine-protein phosphatase n=1 Tax=Wickerhamomyces ciferrii (strain ATCC 14091 / BCRC 22168 / CBS 111 / JCM 3599 / NBRC 0793 / NRRL Y-1031 F-60-10) TaxID=1206466 RepID=K0KVF8_WICCF|nr:putative tyrosine-protein phosphatase [Wickerhamomyces ciferrii]CCH45133.1 putative tyrosine-protein phosphatase [Wickerhamomyces ciferrii]
MTQDKLGPLVPPLRFAALQPRLYRGSYPRQINYRFLKRLGLKYIVSLTPDPITPENDKEFYEFAQENNIQLVHIECGKEGGKRKKRGVPIGYSAVVKALELMINVDYSPLYVHCLNGGQVSSLAIACLRKLSFWSSVTIFNEFLVYTNSINLHDRTFIENFIAEINVPEHKVNWIWTGLSKDIIGSHPTLKFVNTNDKKYSDIS